MGAEFLDFPRLSVSKAHLDSLRVPDHLGESLVGYSSVCVCGGGVTDGLYALEIPAFYIPTDPHSVCS